VRPTSRVLALLELLQAGGIRTVAALADEIAVDERTVRRYVQHLRELDIPVDSVRGRYGGYRLARHYRMPPLMLTDEEALAVVWALLGAARSGSGPASLLAVQSASAKVRRVLPVVLARRIDAVLDTVSFTATRPQDDSDARKDHGGDDGGARVLLTLTEAARDRHPVTFGYTARQSRPTQRRVQPHGVVAHRGRLYLTGFDVTRQANRTFRLDRIVGVRLLEGTFTVPTGTDPVQQVIGPLARTPWRHEVSLRIRADLAHVRSRIPETLASVTPVSAATATEDGWLRVLLRAERLEWVAGTLAMLDRPFVIEHPNTLHHTVAALGRRLVAASSATTDDAATSAWTDEDRDG
jgi:predicted DNA-binding transcriptional regulator YafY